MSAWFYNTINTAPLWHVMVRGGTNNGTIWSAEANTYGLVTGTTCTSRTTDLSWRTHPEYT
jgi:hypothetical protein